MSTVLVTGGSRGIGKAIVEEFAQAGHAVAFTYLSRADSAGDLTAALTADGRKVRSCQADVRDFDRAAAVVQEVETEFGPIDVLINNAGIRRDAALHNLSPEAWRDVLDTNLTGTFNYCHTCIRSMIRRGGVILNVASVSGLSGVAGQTNYCAAKAGIIGFTKALAKEMARFSVRVNAIAPGFIESDMTSSIDEATRRKLYAQIPLGKPGAASEVAKLALYLAGTDASYITGQVFTIDGGLT